MWTEEEFTRQAIDRVAKLLYKHLSLHDEPSEETLATEVSYSTNVYCRRQLTGLGHA